MIGLGLGGHFQKALDESGKETFTKDDIIPIHTKALMDFCEDFSKKRQNWEFFLSLVFRSKMVIKEISCSNLQMNLTEIKIVFVNGKIRLLPVRSFFESFKFNNI